VPVSALEGQEFGIETSDDLVLGFEHSVLVRLIDKPWWGRGCECEICRGRTLHEIPIAQFGASPELSLSIGFRGVSPQALLEF
jgi:hypothetical protein